MSEQFEEFLSNLEWDERLARMRAECNEVSMRGDVMEMDPQDILALINSLDRIKNIAERQRAQFKKLEQIFTELTNVIASG